MLTQMSKSTRMAETPFSSEPDITLRDVFECLGEKANILIYFNRLVTPDLSKDATQLAPWYINYLGGNWSQASACIGAGSNSWQAIHETLNRGLTNEWAVKNTPWSWGHFNRKDIPTHFDIAEGWTVSHMYQVSKCYSIVDKSGKQDRYLRLIGNHSWCD